MSKIEKPENENYAAVVATLTVLRELEGCDNLLGAPLFGFQSLVDRTHTAGELGVVFTAETQLSDDFCRKNNLYRHTEKNADPEHAGYLEDNRRVRAIKLRGHQSNCLFMPISSLAWTGDVSYLKVGDTFDHLNGKEICRKYVIKVPGQNKQHAQVKKFNRVDPKLFPEHQDTAQYFRNSHLIPDDQWVYVTQKIHGTSWRGSRSYVLRKLTLRDRIARKLGVTVQDREWAAVAGSRKVIKDPSNPEQDHFYTSDIWSAYLDRIEHLIPEGFVVYGELIGYTPEGEEIQKSYSYNIFPGTHELFVYRVAFVNPCGVMVDLSWPQVREFCRDRDLNHVPDLWEGPHSDLVAEDWLDARFADYGYPEALPLGSNKKLVDEGICIRADGLAPVILKAKSPIFLGHETSLMDKGEINLEDVGSDAP